MTAILKTDGAGEMEREFDETLGAMMMKDSQCGDMPYRELALWKEIKAFISHREKLAEERGWEKGRKTGHKCSAVDVELYEETSELQEAVRKRIETATATETARIVGIAKGMTTKDEDEYDWGYQQAIRDLLNQIENK